MDNKINFFKDKEDIKIKCTNDNIINITGMIGSGKSTLADKYRNNDNYVVISLDCLYKGQDKKNLNKVTLDIIQILKEKLKEKFEEENYDNFQVYYNEILAYKDKNFTDKILVLEGQHIYRYLDLKYIKGELIIKRTSIFHCWTRSIIRHIKRKKVQLQNNEITKKQYYKNAWYWIKRRTSQLKYYKDMKHFLNEIYKSKLIKEGIL